MCACGYVCICSVTTSRAQSWIRFFVRTVDPRWKCDVNSNKKKNCLTQSLSVRNEKHGVWGVHKRGILIMQSAEAIIFQYCSMTTGIRAHAYCKQQLAPILSQSALVKQGHPIVQKNHYLRCGRSRRSRWSSLYKGKNTPEWRLGKYGGFLVSLRFLNYKPTKTCTGLSWDHTSGQCWIPHFTIPELEVQYSRMTNRIAVYFRGYVTLFDSCSQHTATAIATVMWLSPRF